MATGIIIGVILLAIAIAYWKGGKHKEADITAKGAINVRKTEQQIADELDKIQAGREAVDDVAGADRLWDENSGDPASNASTNGRKTNNHLDQG